MLKNSEERYTTSAVHMDLARNQSGPRILVIGDDCKTLVHCQQALHDAGIVLKAPDSFDHVLELLKNNLFDLIVVGIHSTAALHMLEQIRSHMVEVPALVLASSDITDHMVVLKQVTQAVRAGIQDIVFEPLTATELHTTIRDVIHKHKQEHTRRWNTIQHMIQTEKLAIAGRIVASLAHEMNNPLQALHNALHLLGKRSFNGRKRQQYLGMAQQEVTNLITVVRRMLDLYRPSVEGMRPTNLNKLLETALLRVDKELQQSNVRVLREWYPRLPNVFAIGSRLKQVCMDLITNAIQAMPNGGTLSIRTYTTNGTEYQINAGVEFSPSRSAGHPIKGTSVVVEISDTGIGIAPDALPNIFEPFFTTRIHGAGLGLAISYSIIEQHQGELTVRSEEGQGTTVRMRLPAVT